MSFRTLDRAERSRQLFFARLRKISCVRIENVKGGGKRLWKMVRNESCFTTFRIRCWKKERERARASEKKILE